MDDLTRQQLLLLPERQAVETQRDIGIRAALAWLLAGILGERRQATRKITIKRCRKPQ
jgi:hypothetical protein